MKTKVLLDAINRVLPGTNTKGMVDGTDMLVIINGEFTAYNDRISVSVFVDDPGLDIECAVNAKDFKNVIKGIKEEDIDLSMADGILSIVSEKTEAEIPVTLEIDNILDMIKQLDTADLQFKDLPDDFNVGLSLTRFNVSEDYSDQNNLFCLYLKDGLIYSADNFRLSRYDMAGTTGITCLIPRNNLGELYAFGAVGIALNKGWVHFLNDDDAIFSCRIVEGDYPVNENMFLTDEAKTIKLPNELQDTLEDVTSLYDEVMNSHKSIKVHIDNDKLYCEIEREKIWLKKQLDLPEKDNPKVSFTLSSVFLGEILTFTKDLQITATQAIFQTEVFKHIILLQQD